MIVVTTPDIVGSRIVKTLGLVRGSSVRGHHIGDDVMAILRNVVGGEIPEYTKILAEAREEALDRMIQNAEALDANAIVCARFSTAQIANGAAEIISYGTGVVVE